MSYAINRAVVIGAGTMGGGIAALLANASIPVHLLDLAPRELTPEEEKRGLILTSTQVRHRIVNASLERLKKSPAFKTPEAAESVTAGNLEDDFERVSDGDWIIEVIVERLQPKRELMARIEEVRKPHSIVSSNTSGLPIASIAAETSSEFKEHFLGTHFFTPPWFMKLLEVIPTRETRPEIVTFMTDFAEQRLSKGVIICKDTPNFIANRFTSMMVASAVGFVLQNGYTIEETDAILSPLIGRPRTALFRMMDLIGLDVASAVSENLYELIEQDESREVLRDEKFRALRTAQIERGRLGDKTGQGFYKKPPKDEKGLKGDILTLDLETLEYHARREPEIPSLKEALNIEPLAERLAFVLAQDDKAGALARHVIYHTLAYASRRVPEITDHLINVDRAMRWGYAHESGPFEMWDALGVRRTVANIEASGIEVAHWVKEMLSNGHETFYLSENGRKRYYDPVRKTYVS